MFGTFRTRIIVGLCCLFFLLDSFKQMIFQNEHPSFYVIIDTKVSFFNCMAE